MKPYFLFVALLVLLQNPSRAEPDPFGYGGTITHADISRVERGDTAEKIIAKFGPPAPSEIGLPFLIYELKEDRKKMFFFYFDLKGSHTVKEKSVLRGIEFVDGEKRESVWPLTTKKKANQSPEPTAPSGRGSS